jgi:hypothetical protein
MKLRSRVAGQHRGKGKARGEQERQRERCHPTGSLLPSPVRQGPCSARLGACTGYLGSGKGSLRRACRASCFC